MNTIGVAIIGCGEITLQNHLPGLGLCQDVKVATLCDNNPATLKQARQQTGVSITSTSYEDIVKRDTSKWNELIAGKVGGTGLKPLPVPKEFWTWPGSPRDPVVGDPLVTFRYDQAFKFIDAIRNVRPCNPSFHDGAHSHQVMDAAGKSANEQRWIDLA